MERFYEFMTLFLQCVKKALNAEFPIPLNESQLKSTPRFYLNMSKYINWVFSSTGHRHILKENRFFESNSGTRVWLLTVNTLSDIPLQPRTQCCKKIPIPHLNRKRRREKIGINKNKNSPSKSSPNTLDRSFALRGRSPVKLEKVKDGGGESSTHEIVDLEKSGIYFLPPMLAGFHAVGLSPGRKSGRY
ncbi:hypothetical protein TNIN_297151 [Trichonephila inaurata madagascariensis]|uniref:Uncharacterized protein n=1 Tax=Trichonephila inaurata madagascariensis TaxID=2747483 RepID=A0A8X6WWJ2_9ARAC|nr:hypothetical protein TNIN_297151 [Trichonephila inaurata madagascariensis]